MDGMLKLGWWRLDTTEIDGRTTQTVEIVEIDGPLIKVRAPAWGTEDQREWVMNTHAGTFNGATPVEEPKPLVFQIEYANQDATLSLVETALHPK
jgi:hypothetical protein